MATKTKAFSRAELFTYGTLAGVAGGGAETA